MNPRLNLICVDDTPNSDLCVNWYFKNYHKPGDNVGLLHLYNLPSLSDMFNDGPQSNDQDLKFQIDGVLNNAKDIKEKFRSRCMEMNVTPKVFFENVTDNYGKVICQISDKAYSSLVIMSQDGPRVTGSKAGPDIQVARYVSSNSAAPVVLVPPASMPTAQDVSVAQQGQLAGPQARGPGGPGMGPGGPGIFNTQDNTPNKNPYAGTAILGNLAAGPVPGTPGILGAGGHGGPLGALGGPGFGGPGMGGPMGGGPGPMRGGPGGPDRFNPMARPGGPMNRGPIPADVKGPPFILYCYIGTRVEEGDLYNLFGRYGRIEKVHPNPEKGYGFIHMMDYFEAQEAINALNNTITPLSDKKVQVRFKADKPKENDKK